MLLASINVPSCSAPCVDKTPPHFVTFSHECNDMASVYISICGQVEILWEVITRILWCGEWVSFSLYSLRTDKAMSWEKINWKGNKKRNFIQKSNKKRREIHRIYNKMHPMSYSREAPHFGTNIFKHKTSRTFIKFVTCFWNIEMPFNHRPAVFLMSLLCYETTNARPKWRMYNSVYTLVRVPSLVDTSTRLQIEIEYLAWILVEIKKSYVQFLSKS